MGATLRRMLGAGLVAAIVLGPAATAEATPNRALRRARVDLAVKDADVRDVLTFLARKAGVNVIMTERVKGKVTMYLRRVRVIDALDAVLEVKGLDRVVRQNIVLVMTREEHDRYLDDLRRQQQRD